MLTLSRLSSFNKFRLALLAVASSVLFTAGCSLSGIAPAGNGLSDGAVNGSLSGVAHGGRTPISGATVKAYVAGKTGYGSASHLLATTSTLTDGSGSFSFTGNITCPASNDPNYTDTLYIVLTGGDAGGGTNSATALLAVLGDCATAVTNNPFVGISEVSTFAGMTALQQFFNPATESFGTSPTNVAGLTIAAKTVANIINVGTGLANNSTHQQSTGTNMTGTITITITPESAKIYSAANTLASCVNNVTGSSCTTLFADVSTATVSDTLQAAYYMASNPTNCTAYSTSGCTTSNIVAVFGLATATPPYGGGLSTAPTDWTVGITYTAGTLGVATGNGTCSSTAPFLLYGYGISVDANGNIWSDNGPTNGAMSEISPIGVPMACSGLVGPSRGGAVIDTAGNIWSASGTTGASGVLSYVVKFDGTNTTQITIPGATAKTYAMAADGFGNVFVTDASTALELYEFPSTATATTQPTTIGSILPAGTTAATPYGLAVDPWGTVVVGQSTTGDGNSLVAYALTNVGGTTYGSAQTLAQPSAYEGPFGLAFDGNDAFWLGNSSGTSSTGVAGVPTPPGNTTSSTLVTYSTSTSGAAVTASFATPTNVTGAFAGGMATPRGVAIDGNNNIWTVNNSAASSGLYAVVEFANNGTSTVPTAVSPTSIVGTTTITNSGGFQKATTVLSGPRCVAIDGSGNIWVTNSNSATLSNWVTEIVGAAGPVVTPLSIALKNNKLGQKP